jgi:sugar phosphate isomerase/epimerase
MEVGVILGAPVVRVFAGEAPSPREKEEAFRRAVDGLRKTSAIGAELGIQVALQNHSGLTCTGDGMLRFHREVNHPNFFLLLDTGYFAGRNGPNGCPPWFAGATYDDYYHSIEQVAPLARLVRAKFYEPEASGRERWIDYERVFRILRRANYRGFISLMWEGNGDAGVWIPRSARFLQSFRIS